MVRKQSVSPLAGAKVGIRNAEMLAERASYERTALQRRIGLHSKRLARRKSRYEAFMVQYGERISAWENSLPFHFRMTGYWKRLASKPITAVIAQRAHASKMNHYITRHLNQAKTRLQEAIRRQEIKLAGYEEKMRAKTERPSLTNLEADSAFVDECEAKLKAQPGSLSEQDERRLRQIATDFASSRPRALPIDDSLSDGENSDEETFDHDLFVLTDYEFADPLLEAESTNSAPEAKSSLEASAN